MHLLINKEKYIKVYKKKSLDTIITEIAFFSKSQTYSIMSASAYIQDMKLAVCLICVCEAVVQAGRKVLGQTVERLGED